MILHFHSYGKGFPLIILHGLLGSSDNWHTLAKRLGEKFRVFTLDARNHGRSPHGDEFNYRVMAEDVKEFMDLHKIPSAHLIGHSMGGKTAMQLAITYPDRVNKLIVVDIAPKSYPALDDEILDALRSLDLREFSSRKQVDEALSKKIASFATRQFLLKNLGRTESGDFKWKANIQVLYKNHDEIAKGLAQDRGSANPTLFIRSNSSNYIVDEDTELIEAMFPASKIVTVESGHWIHADAREEFFNIVSEFLSE